VLHPLERRWSLLLCAHGVAFCPVSGRVAAVAYPIATE
jgi:hypothetical protein